MQRLEVSGVVRLIYRSLGVKGLKPSGYYTCMYRQFNIQQFYFLPTQCIYVFCVDLRKTAIISLYCIN